METDLLKKALEAAPILVIALAPCLLLVYWFLKFLNGNIAALTAAVNQNTLEMAKLGGQMIEVVKGSGDK